MMDNILYPIYSIMGWFMFKLTKPETVIYNKENNVSYIIVDDKIIVKCGSKIFMKITYHNMGKYMKIK